MAAIDKLLEKMVQQNAERVVLSNDQPIRLYVAGREATGPVLAAAQLRSMIQEVTPPEFRPQLAYKSAFHFTRELDSSPFDFNVANGNGTLQVTITPQSDTLANGVDLDNLDFAFDAPAQSPAQTTSFGSHPNGQGTNSHQAASSQKPQSSQANGGAAPVPVGSQQTAAPPAAQNNVCAFCGKGPISMMWKVAEGQFLNFCEKCWANPDILNHVKSTGQLPTTPMPVLTAVPTTTTPPPPQILPATPPTSPAPAITTVVNDSGKGSASVLPDELKGYNGGAVLLPWFWCVAHNAWVDLAVWLVGPVAMLIAYAITREWLSALVVFCLFGGPPCFYMLLRFGYSANQTAWQNRRWDSVQHFKDVQKAWFHWATMFVIAFPVFFAVFLGILIPLFTNFLGDTTLLRVVEGTIALLMALLVTYFIGIRAKTVSGH